MDSKTEYRSLCSRRLTRESVSGFFMPFSCGTGRTYAAGGELFDPAKAESYFRTEKLGLKAGGFAGPETLEALGL